MNVLLMSTAVTTTSMSMICPECGTMGNSGKASCCGRGGSWFGKCGSVGNANLDHTWDEGIRACKARQFQAAVGQQLRDSRQKTPASANHVSRGMHNKEGFVAARFYAPTTINAWTTEPSATSIMTLARTSIACDTGTTNTTFIHTSLGMSTPKSMIRTPTLAPNQIIIKSMRSALATMFMTTSSYASASTSTTDRACYTLLRVVTQIIMILIIY